jgi:hypothetical protein
MSKKLKRAMMATNVKVRNKTTGEVMVWYRDRSNKRQTLVLRSYATEELAPKLTDAMMLQWSNLEDLARASLIEIL